MTHTQTSTIHPCVTVESSESILQGVARDSSVDGCAGRARMETRYGGRIILLIFPRVLTVGAFGKTLEASDSSHPVEVTGLWPGRDGILCGLPRPDVEEASQRRSLRR